MFNHSCTASIQCHLTYYVRNKLYTRNHIAGDESHRPLPTRILGPLSKRIVASIAAAENHSLCSTSDGAVFAWGSNGFGQLGIHSSRGNAQQNPPADSRLSPRLVEGKLKQSFVVGVACGERHSVALTRLGEVYCWGDNKKGQLGVINVSETQVSLISFVWMIFVPAKIDKQLCFSSYLMVV